LADPTGSPIEKPTPSKGFTLADAKRYLDQLPDRSPCRRNARRVAITTRAGSENRTGGPAVT
jgi:hypothetical protein